MQVDAGDARPRAFYPDYVGTPPPRHGPPGWDIGPERRIGDGRTAARVLGWFSVGLALAFVAGAAALDLMTARHLSRVWGRSGRGAS